MNCDMRTHKNEDPISVFFARARPSYCLLPLRPLNPCRRAARAVIVDGARLLVMDVMVSQVGEFSLNLPGNQVRRKFTNSGGHGHGQCVGALSVSRVYRGHPTA